MGLRQPTDMRERVRRAAATVLQRNGSVGPLELLQQMLLLQPVHVEGWRRGSPHDTPLEPHIQGSQEKRDTAFRFFLEWVKEQGLQPVEASYLRTGVRENVLLQVTVDGHAEKEQFYRTHYVAGDLPQRQAERLKEKLNKTPEIVVFQLTGKTSLCSECGAEIVEGAMFRLEKQQPLCLSCSDMDHLEFLPSGDATLSRRARKNSPLNAVVVQFNRRRKRYERQGILVASEAIDRAEQSCAADASERAARRDKDVVRRHQEDRELVASMAERIKDRYPGCPREEAERIAAHTADRGSGRVGRSAAGRALDPRAIELAVLAWIRHQHTPYDALLMAGQERLTAREIIRSRVQECLDRWSTSDQ